MKTKPLAASPPSSQRTTLRGAFSKAATQASRLLGSPYAFLSAATGVAVWAMFGPAMKYSENWQLLVNTATTIITFLSVFLIQNTQNREALAMQLKLNEIVHAIEGARNELIDLEESSEDELARLSEEFQKLRTADSADEHPQK